MSRKRDSFRSRREKKRRHRRCSSVSDFCRNNEAGLAVLCAKWRSNINKPSCTVNAQRINVNAKRQMWKLKLRFNHRCGISSSLSASDPRVIIRVYFANTDYSPSKREREGDGEKRQIEC